MSIFALNIVVVILRRSCNHVFYSSVLLLSRYTFSSGPCLALSQFGVGPVWRWPSLALAQFGVDPVWRWPSLALDQLAEAQITHVPNY